MYNLELLQTDSYKYINNVNTGLSLQNENDVYEEYKKILFQIKKTNIHFITKT